MFVYDCQKMYYVGGKIRRYVGGKMRSAEQTPGTGNVFVASYVSNMSSNLLHGK